MEGLQALSRAFLDVIMTLLKSWRRCPCCLDRGQAPGSDLCEFCLAGCEHCHWYKPGHGGHRG